MIGVQVLGGGLNQEFGFHDAVASPQRYDIRLSEADPLLASFTELQERHIRVGISEKGLEVLGTYGYTENATPLAVFEDGTAAITQKAYGSGRAYAIGLDLGFLLFKGYNSRANEIVQTYNNQFDPTLDVWLRLWKSIYRSAQEGAMALRFMPTQAGAPRKRGA